MFLGMQPIYNLKIEIWLSYSGYNTKIPVFVQELEYFHFLLLLLPLFNKPEGKSNLFEGVRDF